MLRAIWTAFLPQHIHRIRFNPTLCKTRVNHQEPVDVDAVITQFSPASPASQPSFTGNISIYNQQGQMEIQVEGITVASFGASVANDRDLYLQTVYKVDPWSYFPEAEYPASSIVDNEPLLFKMSTGGVDGIEEILSRLTITPSDQNRQLLSVCAEQFPSLVPVIVKELVDDSTEQSCLDHQLGHIVDQISHRFPHLRILEVDLSQTGALGARFADSLPVSFVSYTSISPEGATLPSFDNGELQRQPHKVRVRQILQGQFLEDVDLEEDSYDLVIVAGLSDNKKTLNHQMREIRHIMTLGGYLLTIQNCSISLQDRLLRCVSPGANTISQGGESISHKGIPDISEFTPIIFEFHTPRKASSLYVTQATNSTLEGFRSPLSFKLPVEVSGQILLVGGTRPETQAIRFRLAEVLSLHHCDVIEANSLDVLDEEPLRNASAAVILSDLDEPLLASMTATRLAKLQQLLTPNRSILWLTSGFRKENPYHYATLGLFRCVRHETPRLQLQFLDVDTLTSIEDFVTEAFLRLLRTDESEMTAALWSTEYELVLQNGQLWIPRVLPMKDLNRRYNSLRRVITHEVDASNSVVEVLGDHERGDCSWLAKDAGIPVSQLQPLDSTIVVRMLYSSAWAVQISEAVFAFLGVGTTRDRRQVLVISDTNASWSRVPPECTFDIGIDSRQSLTFLARLLAAFIVKAVQRHSPKGMITVYEPTTEMIDVLYAADNKCRWLTSDAQKAASDRRFVFVHPLLTNDMMQALLPVNGTFVSFKKYDVDPRIRDLLPSSVIQIDLESVARLWSTIRSDCFGLPERTSIKEAVLSARDRIQPHVNGTHEDSLVSINGLQENGAQSVFTMLDWVSQPKALVRAQPISATTVLSGTKTYIMVGLTGELGQSLCRFMVRSGARYIVVASRYVSLLLDGICYPPTNK